MTTQPLSFLCRNEIHRYLGLETRMDLIKLVPALRSQNKRLEYHPNRVYYYDFPLNIVSLSIDTTEIVIRETANESDDEKVDVVLEIRKMSGNSTVEFKNCEQNAGIQTMAEKMIAFYLDRPGTIVKESMEGIQWEHMKNWRNCIRTDSFRTYEKISTTGWWRELLRNIRASELHLKYDSTPGVFLEIFKSVNSDFPIGTSVELHGITYDEMDNQLKQELDQLKQEHPGATTDSGWDSIPDDINETWLQVTYPSHFILVEISLLWSVTITKNSTSPAASPFYC